MNSIQLVGRLTRDVETRATPNSKVAKFGFAVTDRRKVGDNWENVPIYVDCELWGSRVDVLEKYCQKGTQLAIQGKLSMDTWEDKNSGQKRSKLFVKVSDFTLLGSANGSGGKSSEPVAVAEAETEDTSIPF